MSNDTFSINNIPQATTTGTDFAIHDAATYEWAKRIVKWYYERGYFWDPHTSSAISLMDDEIKEYEARQ